MVLLPLAAALVIVGAHVTWTQGVVVSYPIFMLAVALLLWYKYRKTQKDNQSDRQDQVIKKKKRRR